MRNLLMLLLVLAMLLVNFTAIAEDGMGVQAIGGEVATEAVSLDDFKLKIDTEIKGYGILTGNSFEFVDKIKYYSKIYGNGTFKSGEDAEYAFLRLDILNTTLSDKNFLDNCTVTATYDDVYQYSGWCYQYDYNKNENLVLSKKEEQFPVQPMFQGHYCFGCTLPNAVVNGTAALYLRITMDDNEITYYIRK